MRKLWLLFLCSSALAGNPVSVDETSGYRFLQDFESKAPENISTQEQLYQALWAVQKKSRLWRTEEIISLGLEKIFATYTLRIYDQEHSGPRETRYKNQEKNLQRKEDLCWGLQAKYVWKGKASEINLSSCLGNLFLSPRFQQHSSIALFPELEAPQVANHFLLAAVPVPSVDQDLQSTLPVSHYFLAKERQWIEGTPLVWKKIELRDL